MALLPKAPLATPTGMIDYKARHCLPDATVDVYYPQCAATAPGEQVTDCQVAIADGGMDVPRSALLNMAQKRTYDDSRRCMACTAVASG
jgi:hypothetical protein